MERLTKALEGKSRGMGQLVRVIACDVVELAATYKGAPDRIVADLLKGCGCVRPADKPVVIQADDLYHLLEVTG